MAQPESINADQTFEDSIAYVRRVLEPHVPRESVWPALLAAAVFALSAVGFSIAAITAPPVTLTLPAAPAAPPL